MRRKPWTPADDAALRRAYPDTPTAKVAAKLGRTLTTVYQRAYRLGLKKSDEYLASPASGRTNGRQGMGTRFQPGLTPWNKGTHWNAGGRSVLTRFKKGEMSGAAQHNHVPIGSYRICKDGYLERKVTDDPRLVPARRWTAVHRLVWEAAHGAIPAGHAVVFKPGRKSSELASITLDCLELVTRGELMRRNSYHRYGKEIARVIQLRGAITRQINKRAA